MDGLHDFFVEIDDLLNDLKEERARLRGALQKIISEGFEAGSHREKCPCRVCRITRIAREALVDEERTGGGQ